MNAKSDIVVSRRRALALLGGVVCATGLASRRALAEAPARDWPKRSEIECRVPRLELIRLDGSKAAFPEELDDGWPIILSFFSTSCPSCWSNNRILGDLQGWLGAEMTKIRFVSIALDPIKDTPDRVADYARQLHAHDHWQFYTGRPDSLAAVESAFGVGPRDGSEHLPTAFLRGAPCAKWVRLEGYAGAETLVAEYRALRKVRAFL